MLFIHSHITWDILFTVLKGTSGSKSDLNSLYMEKISNRSTVLERFRKDLYSARISS